MRSNISSAFARKSILAVRGTALLWCVLGILAHAAPQSEQSRSSATPSVQMSFSTPKEAVETFIRAAEAFDVPTLTKILGPEGKDLISSEDAVRDKNAAAEFAAKARQKNAVVVDPKNSKRATVSIGNDDFPAPIPLVERKGKWYFDTKAGLQEALFRRIGENELTAITLCRGFVEAQKDYAQQVHDNSGVNQYAQRIMSTPGKQDGLAWRNADGSWAGPMGETVARALDQGYGDKAKPFYGYYFKVLKGQGPNARLGQLDYVIGGAMIGGFALVAVPADYRVTGVKTFIVSYDGVVYQKDLGPDSVNIVKTMERYNPDKTWSRTDDNP